MPTREEILTKEKINVLEGKFQDGFFCIVKCLEDHTAENADSSIPDPNDPEKQGDLYPHLIADYFQKNLFPKNTVQKYHIRYSEHGKITQFERCKSNNSNAIIKVEWGNGTDCTYQLHPGKLLPIHTIYEPRKCLAQLSIF